MGVASVDWGHANQERERRAAYSKHEKKTTRNLFKFSHSLSITFSRKQTRSGRLREKEKDVGNAAGRVGFFLMVCGPVFCFSLSQLLLLCVYTYVQFSREND